MDNNIYLNFIYEIAKNNYLKEKIKLDKYLKDKKIPSTQIIKKTINATSFICEIELEKNKILLIDDLPINFLISYTILIGENTQLIEFKTKNKTYICSKELFDIIKEHFEIENNSLKNIKPKELYNQPYNLNFKQPQIIKHLKEYISSIKKLSFNNIHLTKNNKIENFIPTIKKSHLQLAEQMNIPIVNLLENNFIKETTINIYDNEKIKKIINPLFSYEKKILWDIYKDNNLKLYKDVSREYIIKFDKQKIIDELLTAQITNFDKNKTAIEIQHLDSITLSSNHGKYALPVWKSSNEQRFILIENIESFKSMSGVDFKLDTQFYEDIYLQTLSGEQAIYKPRFLCEELNTTFETLSKTQKIEFSSIKELIIKLLYNTELGVLEIHKRENLNKNKIKEFETKIESIINNIIQLAIKHNKTPKYKRPTQIFEQYYFSIANSISKLLEEYKKYPSQAKLLQESLKISQRTLNSLKYHNASAEELYFICLAIMNLLKVLKIYNKTKSNELLTLFNEYFKNFKTQSKYTGTMPEIEKLIDDIFFTNKTAKNKKINIYLKKEMPSNIFDKIEILKTNPTHKKIVKPNITKLKEIFKYSYKDAAKQISNINYHDLTDNIQLKLRDKDVELKKEYYTIFEDYKEYKTILENDFFKALVSK